MCGVCSTFIWVLEIGFRESGVVANTDPSWAISLALWNTLVSSISPVSSPFSFPLLSSLYGGNSFERANGQLMLRSKKCWRPGWLVYYLQVTSSQNISTFNVIVREQGIDLQKKTNCYTKCWLLTLTDKVCAITTRGLQRSILSVWPKCWLTFIRTIKCESNIERQRK